MKKINVFLIILILVFGTYLVYNQLSNRQSEPNIADNSQEQIDIDEEIEGPHNNAARPLVAEKEPLIISERDLIRQINNKKFLEETFMALQYSKINNEQLIDTLKAFLDDNNRMKPEDVVRLVDIHERTYLNRYLRVFVMTTDEEMHSLNSEMRRLMYQMKASYDILSAYGESDPKLGFSDIDNDRPVNRARKDERVFDINKLRQGIHELETANMFINEALQKLGEEDIKIERKWMDANLSENDILEVLDKTNISNLP